jgi:hypothetical protein
MMHFFSIPGLTVFALVLMAWVSPVFGSEILDAARDGDLGKLRAPLQANPDLVLSKDGSGLTPLHMAALTGLRKRRSTSFTKLGPDKESDSP